jgi:hypothetical protein
MMDRKLTIGEWIAEMDKVSAFRRMSHVDEGTLHLNPFSRMTRAWARGIKKHLAKSDIVVVIHD